MKQLLYSEWERLWRRKTTWLLFISIPLLLAGSANFLLSQNKLVPKDAAHYTVAWNFPILGLSEMLMTAFQGIILIIIAFTVTDEYRTGQIRMVIIRAYSYTEIMIAKLLVTIGTIFLFFCVYFIFSYLIGMCIFPTPNEFPLFYHEGTVTNVEGFLYNLKFYGIAFLTSISMVSILFYIAVISRTTTAAIGTGVGFLLFSFTYPMLLSYFKIVLSESLYMKLFFTSIPMIQWEGMTLMLAEDPMFLRWNFSVLSIYTFLFFCLTMIVSKKKESFI